jgi:hypothetical protein
MRLYKLLKLSEKEQIEAFEYLTLVKPKDKFILKGKDVFQLKLKDFDYLRRLMSSGDFVDICISLKIVFRIPMFLIPFLRVNTLFGLINHIIQKLELSRERESKLDSFVDANKQIAMEMSGAKRLNQFGIYNLVDSLANGDKSKWEYYENLPYEKIYFFTTFVTLQGSVNSLFEKNYSDLINKIK